MKAYKAWDEDAAEDYMIVVFAENVSEAKKIALASDELGWDAEWIGIRVKRLPELDHMAKGRSQMDWEDPEDRIALVKLGWTCHPGYYNPDDCRKCPAKDWCDYYNDIVKEQEHGII